jgi:hypothetical protein
MEPSVVVFDIEGNGLRPDKIHLIVGLDPDTGEIFEFRNPGPNDVRVQQWWDSYDLHVGHNALSYDIPALVSVLGLTIDPRSVIDTLVVSRLVDFPRAEGHSLASYGEEFGVPKEGKDITDWSVLTEEMARRCHSDVAINSQVYMKYEKYIWSELWRDAMRTEHDVQWYMTEMKENGFAYDVEGAMALKVVIDAEIKGILDELQQYFPPRTVLVKTVEPKATKHGTIHRGAFKGITDLTPYSVGSPFSVFEWQEFNPGSTKQRIDRLWDAGWQPTERTKGHREFLKEVRKTKQADPERLEYFRRYGWTTDEANLATLPDTAPEGIKKLTRWLLLAPRSRRLQEFLDSVQPDGRIHGTVTGLGAWTHRAAHAEPNTGNIPKFNDKRPETTPYSDKMRSHFIAGKRDGRQTVLVGVDAESIQLRVLAHYMDDKEFIDAIVKGRKEDGTDPHSVNQRALGKDICRSRDDAKTFIYAWVLGAQAGKVSDILKSTKSEAEIAMQNFLDRYENLDHLKSRRVGEDAERGYFEGLDGRFVRIPGDDVGTRRHLCLAGYLQNGEKIVMAKAMRRWYPQLKLAAIPFWLVNWVHDEWQVETFPEYAKVVASTMAASIAWAGESLGLKCPMAGSTLNSHGRLAIGDNWLETH